MKDRVFTLTTDSGKFDIFVLVVVFPVLLLSTFFDPGFTGLLLWCCVRPDR